MDFSKYLAVKPVKYRIARGFLFLGIVLTSFTALVNFHSGAMGYAWGSVATIVIWSLALYLGRYPRYNCLPVVTALLVPLLFQFSAALYSLKDGGPIYWFVAAPVFFFGLGNLYIGASLSLLLLGTLLGHYFYDFYVLHTMPLQADTFVSMLMSYLFVLAILWINERDRVDEEISLNDSATMDFLTKVKNRRGLELVLEENQALLNRYRTPCTVILMDLDSFKHVNDQFGHSVGDDVLINVTNLCEGSLRSTDVLGRWGGEEFVIIVPGLSASQASGVAEKLRQLLMSHQHVDVGVVTASFGVVGMRRGESIKDLMSRVDAQMYEAKKTRNCVRVSE